MSTTYSTITGISDSESSLFLTSFYGGRKFGKCLQLAVQRSNLDIATVLLDKAKARELVNYLLDFLSDEELKPIERGQ